jgi:hypothetical protein
LVEGELRTDRRIAPFVGTPFTAREEEREEEEEEEAAIFAWAAVGSGAILGIHLSLASGALVVVGALALARRALRGRPPPPPPPGAVAVELGRVGR